MKTIISVQVATLLLTAALVYAGDSIRIEGLPQDSEVRIEYSTVGCFHSAQYLLTFTSNVVHAWSLDRLWDAQSKQFSGTETNALGTLTLSSTDTRKLDQLLQFYRSDPSGGCTTIDTITVSLLKDGRVTQAENYRDGSWK